MNNRIDWKRLGRFVFQACRRSGSDQGQLVLEKLRLIMELCGEHTHNGRQTINRLALSLIATEIQPHVIAPCCPDYTHEDGKYTFRDLRGGVSLLTSLHISFMEKLAPILPNSQFTILVADQEANDPALCRVCRKTRAEFQTLVYESLVETRRQVRDRGWRVRAFTEFMPNLVVQEHAIASDLFANPKLASRLTSEAREREEMYLRIGAFRFDEMMERTARTAAQYLALGRRVRTESGIVVNHTTTNLRWYAETEVAVLHNPVCVY